MGLEVAADDVLAREGDQDVGQEVRPVVGVDLDVDGISPHHPEVVPPLGGKQSIAMGDVRAIGPVDDDPLALAHEADDVVARDRGAALGEADHHSLAPVDLDRDPALLDGFPEPRLPFLAPDVQEIEDGLGGRAFPGHLGIKVVLARHAVIGEDFLVGEHLLHLARPDPFLLEGRKAPLPALSYGLFARSFAGFALGDGLLDVGLGRGGLGDLEPAEVGARGGLRGLDLADVAGLEDRVEGDEGAVDRRPDRLVADLGMDLVGEVEGRRPGRELDDLAHRGEDVDVRVEDVVAEGGHEVLGRAALLAAHRDEVAEPMELFLDVPLLFLGVVVLAFLVAPVGGDAGLGDLIHFFGPDLDLVDIAVARDDRRVERLVHVGLRHGDVVLEAPGDRLVGRVDDPEDLVAVDLGLGDDPDGQDVVDFVEGIALLEHLPVNRVDRLDPRFHPEGDLVL